ncbi:MAG TPA: FAD-binding and (Fe-S)-binding domain-containing protein, partial [Acidimicrobiales bacterium]|nr:FAD-binding and (Fe-S)-binding domain-containing protein [Acidimicrobiales bacterium]
MTTATGGGRRYRTHPSALGVDAAALEGELRARLRGEVHFDPGNRAAYSTDASNFRQVPIGVVVPADVDDMVEAVRVCHDHGAPVTNRGGGTSLSGETTNVAVIIDSSKHLTAIGPVDPDRRQVWCEPGVVNDRLREAAGPYGLTFGPDPSTHSRCTIGGNLGNNSCGVHSIMAGRTADNTVELDVLTHDGLRLTVASGYTESEIEAECRGGGRRGRIFADLRSLRDEYATAIRSGFPDLPRRVSGFNLDELLPERGFNLASALVGTEGTCVTILGARLRLVPWPHHRSLLVLGYGSIFDAADHVPELRRLPLMALEAVDRQLVQNMRRAGRDVDALSLLPGGSDYLMLEVGGDSAADAEDRAREAMSALAGDLGPDRMTLFDDPYQAAVLWGMREAGLAATAQVPGEPLAWPGWEDAAVHPDRIGPYLRDLWGLYEEHRLTSACIYGHFGDGCIHSRIPFELSTTEGVARYRAFMEAAADLVVAHGGSLSGEHGDGQQRAELLERMYGPGLVAAMGRFKAIWDPDNRMNPGKVVDALSVFRLDDNLRIGPGRRAADPPIQFGLPDDNGSLERAVNRCIGVGRCRVGGGQAMCPSFQVTGDERHSTRGRARILFEMLQGEVITDGWRSPEVAEALDLCLSCKACRSDCPVGVDMATYKAEFMSHHYRGRIRPLHAYATGLVMFAARAGAAAPGVANRLLASPPGALLKRIAGVHPDRRVPPLAPETFRHWFADRPVVNPDGRPVLLFADTFSNHFHPEVARDACRVLEAAGLRVSVPTQQLCCGRPLFDHGMLGLARRLFRRTLGALAGAISAGTPVVVLEPSCCASFRHELGQMLPDSVAAQRLSELTMTLAEALERLAPEWRPPPSSQGDASALLQAHCHQQAVMGLDADRRLLARAGVDLKPASSGCCGL